MALSRYYDVGGWKVAPTLVLSAADIALAGTSVPGFVDSHRSGMGDLRLGAALWVVDDPQARHFLGLHLMTVWPTGRYDKTELANPGEHRNRHALTLGWIRGLTENLTLELTPELAWYGGNKESFPGNVEVKQHRTLSLTGYLRYRFNPAWQGYVGGQLNEEGERRVNGVERHDPIGGRREFVGGSYALDKDNTLDFRWSADSSVRTGLKTTGELALRWVRRF